MDKLGYEYADNGAQEIECDYLKDMSVGFASVAINQSKSGNGIKEGILP